MFFAEDDDAAAGQPTPPEAEAADCMKPVFDSDIMPVPRDDPEQRVGAAAAAAQVEPRPTAPAPEARRILEATAAADQDEPGAGKCKTILSGKCAQRSGAPQLTGKSSKGCSRAAAKRAAKRKSTGGTKHDAVNRAKHPTTESFHSGDAAPTKYIRPASEPRPRKRGRTIPSAGESLSEADTRSTSNTNANLSGPSDTNRLAAGPVHSRGKRVRHIRAKTKHALNKIATANKSRGEADIVWTPKHRIKFAMTVLGKVAPPLAHMKHTLSDTSIAKLPRYAQDAIGKSKSTLEQYRNEAQKCLNGNSKIHFRQ